MGNFDVQETLAILGVLGSGIAYLIKASQDARKENDARMTRIFDYFDNKDKNDRDIYLCRIKELEEQVKELIDKLLDIGD